MKKVIICILFIGLLVFFNSCLALLEGYEQVIVALSQEEVLAFQLSAASNSISYDLIITSNSDCFPDLEQFEEQGWAGPYGPYEVGKLICEYSIPTDDILWDSSGEPLSLIISLDSDYGHTPHTITVPENSIPQPDIFELTWYVTDLVSVMEEFDTTLTLTLESGDEISGNLDLSVCLYINGIQEDSKIPGSPEISFILFN